MLTTKTLVVQLPIEGQALFFPDRVLEAELDSWNREGQQVEAGPSSLPQGRRCHRN